MAEYDKIRINTMEEAAAGIIDAGRITPKKLAHAIRERAQAKLVPGANITIDNTDPDAPVISATGGGGGGAVDSVNGETGDVTGLQWQLTEGSGIDINNASPKSPVISANAQEILNAISATQGAVLFRGPSGWEALPPGTNTQYLKSGGPSADPVWQTPSGGGGGGGWVVLDHWQTSDGPFLDRDVDVTGYSDLLISGKDVTMASSSWRVLRVSVDGGASYLEAGQYQVISNTGTTALSNSELYTHTTANAGSRQIRVELTGINSPYPQFIAPRSDNLVGRIDTILPITHVRLGAIGVAWTAGDVYVMGR